MQGNLKAGHRGDTEKRWGSSQVNKRLTQGSGSLADLRWDPKPLKRGKSSGEKRELPGPGMQNSWTVVPRPGDALTQAAVGAVG